MSCSNSATLVNPLPRDPFLALLSRISDLLEEDWRWLADGGDWEFYIERRWICYMFLDELFQRSYITRTDLTKLEQLLDFRPEDPRVIKAKTWIRQYMELPSVIQQLKKQQTNKTGKQ